MDYKEEKKKKILHNQEVELDFYARRAYKKVKPYTEPDSFTLTQWIRNSRESRMDDNEQCKQDVEAEQMQILQDEIEEAEKIENAKSADDKMIEWAEKIEAKYQQDNEHNPNESREVVDNRKDPGRQCILCTTTGDSTYETPSKHENNPNPPSEPAPVTEEKQVQKDSESDGTSHEDNSVCSRGSSEVTREEKCMRCNKMMYHCHQKQFSLYCIDAIEREFRNNPLDITRKKCNTIFTLAYNRAYDFRHFQEFLQLPPHALYYPPGCLKAELYEFMGVLETDQRDYIDGKMKFQPDIEVNTLEDLNSQIESYCSSYEIPEGTNKTVLKYELDICDDCGKSRYKCHYRLFGEYCFAHVNRMFDLYPVAMTEDATKRVYLKWYNSALHFLTWEMTQVYLKKFVVLPPRCLERSMENDVAWFKNKRAEYLEKNKNIETEEFIENSMNFDGMEFDG